MEIKLLKDLIECLSKAKKAYYVEFKKFQHVDENQIQLGTISTPKVVDLDVIEVIERNDKLVIVFAEHTPRVTVKIDIDDMVCKLRTYNEDAAIEFLVEVDEPGGYIARYDLNLVETRLVEDVLVVTMDELECEFADEV